MTGRTEPMHREAPANMMSRTNWTIRVVLELSTIVLAIVVADAWGWWAVWPAAVLIGSRVHALLILGHIGAHRRNGYPAKLGDFVTRWFVMGATGMDLTRYRRMHAAHHAFISQPGKDPEVDVVETFRQRWSGSYHPLHTVKDLLGLHSAETRFLIKELATAKSYVTPTVIAALSLVFFPIGAIAFILSPFVGAITVHRLRAWTEHDHFKHPGYTFTMPKPSLWRRYLYLPHDQWKHAQHHGGLTMEKPFSFP